MSKKKLATRPVGRPKLNLPTKPRHFLQVERTSLFDNDLQTVRRYLSLDKSVPYSDISQSEAVRYAVHFYATRGSK